MPSRRKPTHGVSWLGDLPPIIFLTVCTKQRKPWLADAAGHSLLAEVWRGATRWRVGRYVLMPDHLHLFASPSDIATSLEKWITHWKSKFTKLHRNPGDRWQSDHWDTRLRNSESYDDKWRYVRETPVRAGLVDSADDWPYQGELFDLRWD